jgi:hypothetical protein
MGIERRSGNNRALVSGDEDGVLAKWQTDKNAVEDSDSAGAGVEGLVAFGSPLRIAYGVSTGGYRLTKAGSMALDISNREQEFTAIPRRLSRPPFQRLSDGCPGLNIALFRNSELWSC